MIDDKHILVVDDDRRIRELLKRFLLENNYRVTTAEDAAAARSIMSALMFDLIILDVMMPGENGFTLTRAIREGSTPCQRAIPIMLLTARADADDRIEGLSEGADDYLPKPFEPQELLLRVGAILRRSNMAPLRVETDGPLRFGTCTFRPEITLLEKDGDTVHLTAGEAALLKTLATDPGVPFARGVLLERIGAAASEERAVDVQITRLRRKIEEDPKRPRHIQTVRGEGYMLIVY